MCKICYRGYGKPIVLNDAVLDAVKLVDAVYRFDEEGGNLHDILVDWSITKYHSQHSPFW